MAPQVERPFWAETWVFRSSDIFFVLNPFFNARPMRIESGLL